ncbi:MAG: hypothetical protein MJA84_09220, partial [Firmicutes bacterium]|nr:hypothetical protein [Bacillota bacterium]
FGSFNGSFTFASEDGVFRIDRNSKNGTAFEKIYDNIVYSITETMSGGLFLSTPWDFIELHSNGDYTVILKDLTSITSIFSNRDNIWVGNQRDVKKLKKGEDGWVENLKLSGFEGGAVYLVEDPEDGLWVSTNSNHIYRYLPSVNQTEINNYSALADFGSDDHEIGEIALFKYQGKPWVLTEDWIFEWQNGNQFKPLYSSSSFAMESWNWKWLIPLHFPQNEDLWLIRKHRKLDGYQIGKLKENSIGNVIWEGHSIPDISHLGEIRKVANYIDINNEETLVIAGTNGIKFLNLKLLEEIERPNRPRLNLNSPAEEGRTHNAFKENSDIPPRFSYFIPHFNKNEPLFFQTRLRGLERAWTEPSTETHREFPGLRSGNYTFEVRTINGQGKYSTASAIGFLLLPPWYRTIPAFLIYGFFL